MKRYLLPALLVLTLPISNAAAQYPYNTQRGSVLGGLAGAAAGAAIGEHNDKPLAGALIGGVLGLATGAAMGNTRDRQRADERAYQYHRQQQVQYYQQQQVARTVTIQDVIAMSRSGLSDTVIINHVQANGVRQDLQVADVITLHENGVSQAVITVMQRPRVVPVAPVAPVVTVPTYRAPAPIIVEQYVTPQYHYSPPRPYYNHSFHHQHSQRPGVHFSFHH